MERNCYDTYYGCWIEYIDCPKDEIEERYFPEVKYYYQSDDKVYGTKTIEEIRKSIEELQKVYTSTISKEFETINTKEEFMKYWKELTS